MLTKKLTQKRRKQYRLFFSVALTVLLFIIVYFFLPTRLTESTGERKIIKAAFISIIFGFLPFYILPWLKWIMGHENDWEKNMDGEPLDEADKKI